MMKRFVYLLAFIIPCLGSCKGADDPANTSATPADPIATFFPGEVKPAVYSPCFNGAYYRKIVSSKDVWLGISGKVVLPAMTFDPARVNPAKPQQYLDNPSVYMGGNMGGQETDIGLTWEVIRDEQGNVSADRRAFRPFLRRSPHAASGQAASYENAPAVSNYYWYPGEEVSMSVQIIAEGKVKFIVEGAGKRFEKDFDCAGFKPGAVGDFKRVNAIDQVANEGKPAQPTKTKVEHASWKETSLFRVWQDKVVSVPMHKGRATDMRCPNVKFFRIAASDEERQKGAETIDISGAGY